METFSGTLSFMTGRGVYGEPLIEHVTLEHATIDALLSVIHERLNQNHLLMGMVGQTEQKIELN